MHKLSTRLLQQIITHISSAALRIRRFSLLLSVAILTNDGSGIFAHKAMGCLLGDYCEMSCIQLASSPYMDNNWRAMHARKLSVIISEIVSFSHACARTLRQFCSAVHKQTMIRFRSFVCRRSQTKFPVKKREKLSISLKKKDFGIFSSFSDSAVWLRKKVTISSSYFKSKS